MTIPEIKYQLFKAIDRIEDDKLLIELLHILQKEDQDNVDFWDLLTDEQRTEIDIAVKESNDSKKFISNEKLQKRLKGEK
ncbi:MAG: hypothetical protein WCK13_04130 [Ignavibacteriota bacterium]|nr:hypothetical protein [Ignavibacteriota bacterium]